MITGPLTIIRPAAQNVPAGPGLVAGPAGQSAYALAVALGYDGTLEQWLASLVGPAGGTGATGGQGPPGKDGVTQDITGKLDKAGNGSDLFVVPGLASGAGTLAKLLADLGSGRITVDVNGVMAGLKGLNVAPGPAATLFVRNGINVSNGITAYIGTSDFSTPRNFEILADQVTFSAAKGLKILPTAASLARALNVVQSGPTSGSVAGPVTLNSFDTIWSSGITGGYGTPGLAGAGALIANQFSLNVGGPNLAGTQFITLSAGLIHDRSDTSSGDKFALSAGVHSTAVTQGLLDGACFSVVSDSGSSSPQIAGVELDMAILGTGTTPNRLGAVVVNTGSKVGTSKDIAYALTTGGPDGTVSGAFRTLLGLYKQDPSLPNAMGPEGRIFASDHALTISDVLYGPNVSVSGNILLFPGVVLTGAGKLTTSQIDLYGDAPAVPTGHVGFGGGIAPANNIGPTWAGALVINVGGVTRFIPYC